MSKSGLRKRQKARRAVAREYEIGDPKRYTALRKLIEKQSGEKNAQDAASNIGTSW